MTMVASNITFVAGPSLIAVVVILILVKAYEASTRGRDEKRAQASMATRLRRCNHCGEVVAREATSCRHCLAELGEPNTN